jgi:LuxR family transcriptional regulator, maltose regulon positive regulatory protein
MTHLTAERGPLAAVSGGLPMAEQTAAPAGADATGQDVLLATKLYVPRPPAGLVARPRLAGELGRGLAGGLILVSAPAGFGKTALLADWIRREGRPAGWLSLDAGDNDPARFWRHAAAALDRACPGIGERVGPLLGPPPPHSFEGPVTALINELAVAAGDAEVLLVLDDYHVIEAGPVHASVEFLLEHRPPGLRLVLASRSDPPLPLPRLRARGQLTEVRAADLRFTADEAAALLRRATGADLPDGSVAALARRTEGWAVGLQLVALSLRGHCDVTGFVAAFSGSHRYILDYLAEEVLDRQPEQMRAFLLQTSVLERLSGELCDAVTGHTGSQALLEDIERAGLFLAPLDEVRGWWRYHPLFADLLRVRLQQDLPGTVPALHRAAAAWFESRGLVHEAIRHALDAGQAAWAARMIERNFDELLERAEGTMVDRWVAALPAELVRSRPRLRLAQAVWVILSGRLAQAERLLADAERALEDGGDDPTERLDGRVSLLANVPALIALLRAGIARRRGDSERMEELTRQARTRLSADDQALRPMVDLYVAAADQLRGRTSKAERNLSGAVTDQHTAGGRYLAVSIACDLGKVRQAQGELDGALRAYEQALEIVTEAGLPLPLTGMAYLGMAEVLYERDDLDSAARHATDGIALCRQLAETQPLATGLARLAWIRHAQGDRAGALEAMNEALQLAPVLGAAGLLNPVAAQHARLQLACGDVAAAASWTRQSGVSASDEPDYRTEPEHLVLARVLLAQGRSDAAVALLERWLTAAAAAGRTASTIQIYTLLALALAARGDQARALRTLSTALALACPRGFVRLFADEGAPMAALLGQLAAAQRAGQAEASSVPADRLALILESSGRKPATPSEAARAGTGTRAAEHGLAEPLTERELEVLRLLAAGRSNQRIARDLTVALDTAKKHVSHILAKVGAASRTEAVARARELGLIP